MDRLKAELRHAMQHDAGTDEEREALVNELVAFLSEYFTPLALANFTGAEARQMMIKMMADADLSGYHWAAENFMSHIGLLPTRRQLPKLTVNIGNVINIFSKR